MPEIVESMPDRKHARRHRYADLIEQMNQDHKVRVFYEDTEGETLLSIRAQLYSLHRRSEHYSVNRMTTSVTDCCLFVQIIERAEPRSE